MIQISFYFWLNIYFFYIKFITKKYLFQDMFPELAYIESDELAYIESDSVETLSELQEEKHIGSYCQWYYLFNF